MRRREFVRDSLAGIAGISKLISEPGRSTPEESAGTAEGYANTDVRTTGSLGRRDIRELNQHFNVTGGDISPWTFVPNENIKEISTSVHPGLLVLWEAGKGKDIKGILQDPIHIDDYRLPWQFQLAMVQNFDVLTGRIATQANTAIGLNVAVTFSDPSRWPHERTEAPPETHSVQLLVVHVGNYGEVGVGLPQYTTDPHPETYLVWGRGDLGYTVMGDWQIPSVWIGDGARYAGPASNQLYFRCVVVSPTRLQIGIKFDASHGWNMREIDCSKFGRITGIWELGPVLSCDRWIPDVLCRSIPTRRPYPALLGGDAKHYHQHWVSTMTPEPEPPNPIFEYYIDYCVFFGAHPIPFEQYSDDFDIPGYMGQWQIQEQGTMVDTYSHPGHLTMTLLGPGLGTGVGPVGGGGLKLSDYKPPWEIETCFIAPDDTSPWNWFMNFEVLDKQGQVKAAWQPGVYNDLDSKRHRYMNSQQDILSGARTGMPSIGTFSRRPAYAVEFKPEVPESVLAHKPLYMLIQVIDATHVRVGFKADAHDPWILSQAYDCSELSGGEVGEYGMHVWGSVTGQRWGAPPGAPMYQRFLVDYFHYRYGISTNL